MFAVSSISPAHHQQEQAVVEEQYNVLFCRALYDYEAQDASALSFRRDDIIEVLTQQPSGWWDGLLGKERGWFPSNYVVIISDEEAELFFSTEYSTVDDQHLGIPVDIPHSTAGGTQAENEEWLDSELSFRNGNSTRSNQPSDFWMPEVTPDGQVGVNSRMIQSFSQGPRYTTSTHKQDNVPVTYLMKPTMKFLMGISLALHPRRPLVQASVLALLLEPMMVLKLLRAQRTSPGRMVLMKLGSKN